MHLSVNMQIYIAINLTSIHMW